MSKQKLGYLLFDLPSDHEVESSLATECQTIEAIIHNLGMSTRVKRICVASPERFMKYPTYKLSVQFVHLSCHGGKTGIGMLGGNLQWEDVAKQITRHLHPLKARQKRIICFSCCHSRAGFNRIKKQLSPYFSGAYFLKKQKVPFSQAIVMWSMFYLKKDLKNPHNKIVTSINEYMGEELLAFKKY